MAGMQDSLGRKGLDKTCGSGLGEGKKRRPSTLGLITEPEVVAEESPLPISEGESPASAISSTLQQKQESPLPPVPAASRMRPSRHATVDTFAGPIPAITIDGDYDNLLAKSMAEDEYDYDTDEEDKFFDVMTATTGLRPYCQCW